MKDFKLLKNKNFLYFVLSQGISGFGDIFFDTLILLLVYDSTKSVLQSAMVGIAWHISSIILSPIAGALSDSYDRKKILISSNFIGFIITFFIALFYLFNKKLSLPVALSAIILSNIAQTFIRPASRSILPDISGEENIESATGALSYITNIFNFIGTLSVGFIIEFLGGFTAIVIDSITFFIASVIIAFINIPQKSISIDINKNNNLLENIRNGWEVLKANVLFKRIVVAAILINVMSFIGPLLPAFIDEKFNGGSIDYSIIETISLIAGILVGTTVSTLTQHIQSKKLITYGWIGMGLSILGTSLFKAKFIIYIMFFLQSLFRTVSEVNFDIFMLREVEQKFRGRIIGIVFSLSVISIPLSTFIAGIVGERLPVMYIFMFAGIYAAIIGVVCLITVKRSDDPPEIEDQL
ncbi:MFS transporter [Acidilutibacter cellobiosedens]|nr:MFS transporter [Acidilutibacter cellobiosedens]